MKIDRVEIRELKLPLVRFFETSFGIEVAQRIAGDSNAKTTGLYDRRNDDISVGEVGRIGI